MENKKMNITNAQLNENELENVTGGMDRADNNLFHYVPDHLPIDESDYAFRLPILDIIPLPPLSIPDVDVSFDMEVTIRKQ